VGQKEYIRAAASSQKNKGGTNRNKLDKASVFKESTSSVGTRTEIKSVDGSPVEVDSMSLWRGRISSRTMIRGYLAGQRG